MAIRARLQQPLDGSSLATFRIGFGLLLLVAALRYFAHGWVTEHFQEPQHFFKYWGFSWVRAWPGWGMQLHFGLMALCAAGVLLGYRYRASVIGFGLLFGYAHLIDKTHYLNHYYLVVCVCALMACLPLGAIWSLDARREPAGARARFPAWMLWALRAQFGLVYFFGGVAKLNADWLLHAQPLTIWLGRFGDAPAWLAFAMSWAGALFDLAIVPLLLQRRARPWVWPLLLAFHLLTARWFQIGLFPYFMICGSSLFFEPNWPRRLLERVGISHAWAAPSASGGATAPRWLPALLGAHFALQLLLPLRHWAYPGSSCWTEQGFRFSWNVMLMEKDGSVDFRVVEPSSGRSFHVSPRAYYTAYQTAMMASQPDMVLEAAQLVSADFRMRGVKNPAVYADAFASLNGRPMQRLIDPSVDLARESDGLWNKPWILPMTTRYETATLALARSPR